MLIFALLKLLDIMLLEVSLWWCLAITFEGTLVFLGQYERDDF